MSRIRWTDVVPHAARIVAEYSAMITLRQLFYRLVADGTLPNLDKSYKGLSRETAKGRRAGTFPRLVDRTRRVQRYQDFASPEDARDWLRNIYQRPRTEGQDWNIYIGVEKDALAGLLEDWFADLGVGIVAVRGYSSESLLESIADEVAADGRPAVMLYGGDFDPTGEDILRDLGVRLPEVEPVRVALTAAQVASYNLPPAPGKQTDPRASSFAATHGRLVQVELDALPPTDLQHLYRQALAAYWDESVYDAVLEREERERATL